MLARACLSASSALVCAVIGLGPVAKAQERALPTEATRILSRMNADIVVAKRKAATALDALLKETTKKGDLEGALAIKKELESLAIPAGGTMKPAAAILGKWQADKFVLEFTADGKVVNQSNGDTGQWRETGNSIDVAWANGWRHQMRLMEGGFRGMFLGPKGETGPLDYSRLSQ